MKKLFATVGMTIAIFTLYADQSALRVLHIGFHKGCLDDFAEVGKELGLEVTSWYVLSAELDRTHFDGISTGNAVYNISHDRAERVWDKHKSYFKQFDVIVTSDTAPLARIFLQNGWEKPLIIWICNRFDYYDPDSLDGAFPDNEYYDLIRKATHMQNVKIVSYTPYEHIYARAKGVDIGTLTIKPIGTLPKKKNALSCSAIPASIDKKHTIFIYPRLESDHVRYIAQQCSDRDIQTYSGGYNGPEDLTEFKGVLYVPYQLSNLALFENLQRGIVHFVPSQEFMHNARRSGMPIRCFISGPIELCEWYFPEYRNLLVFFDSWDDLAYKVKSTDYNALSSACKKAGAEHRKTMVTCWKEVLQSLVR